MDFERVSEMPIEEAVKTESGYSEQEAAKIIEGTKSDVKQLGNKRKPLISPLSRKDNIIALYKMNLEKIFQLIETIAILEGKSYRQEEQIVEEIKKLRHLQEELLNALLLEQKGTLTKESISKQAWDLIQ